MRQAVKGQPPCRAALRIDAELREHAMAAHAQEGARIDRLIVKGQPLLALDHDHVGGTL